MVMNRIVRLAPALLLLAWSGPALAQGEWGALAIAERGTAYGYAYDFPTPEAASARALAECGKNAPDCRVHTTFRNTCMVVAGSIDGPMGWSWGGREASRAQRAIEQCHQRGAVNCKVVETVCSGTTGGPSASQGAMRRQPAAKKAPAASTPGTTTPPAASTPPPTGTPGQPTPLHKN